MKKDHKVYYHRSRTSGKYYVGVAKNIDKRWGTDEYDAIKEAV